MSFLLWLEGEVPSVHATLAPPATAKAIKKLTNKWGKLPDDFLELYQAHDGQVGEGVDFVPSYCLMPIESILLWRSNFEELAEELDEDEDDAWDDAWIPFAQLPVYLQFLCLHSKTGEVIEYDHKGQDWAVIAPSFGELLMNIRLAVKRREYVVSNRGIAERARKPSKPKKPHKQAKQTKKPKRGRPRSR